MIVKRKLDGAVDESSVDQEIRTFATINGPAGPPRINILRA